MASIMGTRTGGSGLGTSQIVNALNSMHLSASFKGQDMIVTLAKAKTISSGRVMSEGIADK